MLFLQLDVTDFISIDVEYNYVWVWVWSTQKSGVIYYNVNIATMITYK